MGSICVFADSIAWGADDSEKLGWVSRLALWDKDLPQRRMVYNLGIANNTTADVIARVTNEARARQSGVIIYAVGIVDTGRDRAGKPRVSIEDFEINLQQLVTLAKEIVGDQIIFIGLTPADESRTQPVFWNPDASYSMKDIRAYDSIIQQTASKNGIGYIHMLNKIDLSELKDGLHPNEAGHQKMFELIRAYLTETHLA